MSIRRIGSSNINGQQSFNSTSYAQSMPTLNPTFDINYLVVAGGAGGGATYSGGGGGGGGGAGGYRCSVSGESSGGGSSAESVFKAFRNVSYTVTVGAGGAGAVYNGALARNGTNGNDSVAFTITSTGGGGGGGQDANGNNGGAGGGAGGFGGTIKQIGGTGTANQGYAGGGGTSDYGGAGGGAGSAGSTITAGSGVASSITGTSTTRAAGGAYQGSASASANTANGGAGSRTTANGGSGGSGVVVLKFPDSATITVGAGLTQTNATSGGFKTYIFTAGTGTVTFS